MKSALICGAAGQDGAYLAKHLIDLGYRVYGTSRDAAVTSFANLHKLGIRDRVTTKSMSLTDFRSVLSTVNACTPDEIYNLAGQTSVGLSFEQPVETLESIVLGTLNLLEAIRFLERPIKFYNAGSGECFGDRTDSPATELTPFNPRSPYAVAKASATYLVSNYREAFGMYACSGILFNHESFLRPERFVTQKIIRTAARIACGSPEKLVLGNLDVVRDWGWAPEYVVAMHRMLQQDTPDDFIVATGKSVSLRYFAERAFAFHGLNIKDFLAQDATLMRPSDIAVGSASAEKAFRLLGWQPKILVEQVVDLMSTHALEMLHSG